MKKLIAGLFAAVLTTAGLVAVSGTSATAAPYPGTVKTTSSVSAPKAVKAGKKATVKATVKASGNAKAKGTVTILIKKGARVIVERTVAYKGKTVKVATPKLKKKGAYKVTVTYKPTKGSVFKASKKVSKIKVK